MRTAQARYARDAPWSKMDSPIRSRRAPQRARARRSLRPTAQMPLAAPAGGLSALRGPECPGSGTHRPLEELPEVGGLRETQHAPDGRDRKAGMYQQPLGFQGDAVVDE